MNLREIEYFVSVAELGHFGKAADKCCVTQPTLSGQLKKLEDELGQPLFDRNTRSVSLTSFGEEAFVIAKKIMYEFNNFQQLSEQINDPFSGELKLGAFPTLCPWLFPKLAPFFKKTYPLTHFLLIEEKSPVLSKMLEDGEIDAAILAIPDGGKGIEMLPLFSEPFYALVFENHPWAHRKKIPTEDLENQKLLLLEDGHCLRNQALDLCHKYGGDEEGTFRATSLETLRQMVRLEQGITLIPQLAVPEIEESNLKYIPFSTTDARRDIGIFFRSTHPKKKFFEDFAHQIHGLCGNILPAKALVSA
ncbi:MAG: LysR substrate-binding domain-containing protein [Spirochaetales bacterium]|nr:LysR substrate-binding domain-containing protein [Spirochaetales bacterium]